MMALAHRAALAVITTQVSFLVAAAVSARAHVRTPAARMRGKLQVFSIIF